MSLISIIKWNASPNVLAWKYPSEGIGIGSQLIVAESQEAFLIKGGQIVMQYGVGRHTLKTENVPGLNMVFNMVAGGAPIPAEVWFIQRTFSLDIRWGTPDAMLLEDPEYKIILPIRAFGQYGMKVKDSRIFLEKMVGTLPAYTVETLTKHFKGIILSIAKSTIAKALQRNAGSSEEDNEKVDNREKKEIIQKLQKCNITALNISAHLDDISEALQKLLVKKLALYGVELVEFNVNSINTDESDPAVARLRRIKAERAEMDILQFNYQQKRSFDVMETAAGNEGSGNMQAGMMGAGMGMGMGFGMGQNMAQFTQQMNMGGVRCPSCGMQNSAQSRFCQNCAAPLTQPQPAAGAACPSCGTQNPPHSKFCQNCGSPLAKPQVPSTPLKCSGCGADNPPASKFCQNCGAKL